jgi:hypothetical protein
MLDFWILRYLEPQDTGEKEGKNLEARNQKPETRNQKLEVNS